MIFCSILRVYNAIDTITGPRDTARDIALLQSKGLPNCFGLHMISNTINVLVFQEKISWAYWCLPSVSILEAQGGPLWVWSQSSLHSEFQAVLVYLVHSRPIWVTQWDPASKQWDKQTKKQQLQNKLYFHLDNHKIRREQGVIRREEEVAGSTAILKVAGHRIGGARVNTGTIDWSHIPFACCLKMEDIFLKKYFLDWLTVSGRICHSVSV